MTESQMGRPPKGGRYVRVEPAKMVCDKRQCPVPDTVKGTRVRLPAFQKWGQLAVDVSCGVCGFKFPTEWEPTPLPDDYAGDSWT